MVGQFLIAQKRDELHHLPVRLNLAHVLFYGQLLALEEAGLLSLVDVKRSERVHKQVRFAVVVVALDHDVRCRRGLFEARLLRLLELDLLLAEVVRVNSDVVVVGRLVGEGLRDHVLLGKVEGAHRPLLVALESGNRVYVAEL